MNRSKERAPESPEPLSALWTRVMLTGDALEAAAARLLAAVDITSLDTGDLIETQLVFVDPPHSVHIHGGPNAGNHHYNVWTTTVSAQTRTYPNPNFLDQKDWPGCVGRGCGRTLREAVLRAIVNSFGEQHPEVAS